MRGRSHRRTRVGGREDDRPPARYVDYADQALAAEVLRAWGSHPRGPEAGPVPAVVRDLLNDADARGRSLELVLALLMVVDQSFPGLLGDPGVLDTLTLTSIGLHELTEAPDYGEHAPDRAGAGERGRRS